MSVPSEELPSQPLLTEKKETNKKRQNSLAHLKCLLVAVVISTWRHIPSKERSVFRFLHVGVTDVKKN